MSHLTERPGLLPLPLTHLVPVILVVLPPQQSFSLAQDQLFLTGRLVHVSHLRQQEGGDLYNRSRCDVTGGRQQRP